MIIYALLHNQSAEKVSSQEKILHMSQYYNLNSNEYTYICDMHMTTYKTPIYDKTT